MMPGYWKNEEATRQAIISDGWMKTGDVAITKNGKWWIVDRRKELIKVNVYQLSCLQTLAKICRASKWPQPNWKPC